MNTCSTWEVIISKRIYNLHLTTTPIKTKDFKVILCKKKSNISLLYIITYAFLRSSLTSSSSKCRSIWRNLTAFNIKVLWFPFRPRCSLSFLTGSGWGKSDFLQPFICIYLSFITNAKHFPKGAKILFIQVFLLKIRIKDSLEDARTVRI